MTPDFKLGAGQLEGGIEKFQPLFKAFDGFVAQQPGIGRSSVDA